MVVPVPPHQRDSRSSRWDVPAALPSPQLQPEPRRDDPARSASYVARCVLAAGLLPSVARTDLLPESKGDGKRKTRLKFGFRTTFGRVAIHPTSGAVLRRGKHLDNGVPHFLLFNEKIQTSRVSPS